MYVTDFRPLFFSSICIQCYNFPSKDCFCHILQILISYILIFKLKKYFKIYPEISFFWPMCNLELYYLTSAYWGIFQLLFFIDFWFNSFVVWEKILHVFSSFKCIKILSKLWEMVKDREAWYTAVYGVTKSQSQMSNWTTTESVKLCL